MLREPTSAVRRPSYRVSAISALALVVVLLGFAGYRTVLGSRHHVAAFPQSAAMEDQLGIRFSRVAVVADEGLITVTYVVLDSEKAGRFQSDVAHPPALVSESRQGQTTRVSLMKQGHVLRTGQTYYLVYQNTKAALRSGELATIAEGSLVLPHVPVL